jgi:hypothetical protein
MTTERSQAYVRLMRELRSPEGMVRTTLDQREALRDAADTLVLAPATGPETHAALASARTVLVNLLAANFDPWLEDLADDLDRLGPTSERPAAPAVPPSPGVAGGERPAAARRRAVAAPSARRVRVPPALRITRRLGRRHRA